jgi:RecA/RadA recombinase
MIKSKEEKPLKETVTSQGVLGSFLKANKSDHYNFEEEVTYKVSSGSLQFDLQLNGGFGPGLHRFVGMNEGGKEQPVSEPVLTPTGWITIGSLSVGDEIIDSNGKKQTVLAVYPQGVKDVYEITFNDGSKTKCGLNHLWETSSFQERHNGGRSSVKKFEYIMNSLRYGKNLNHSIRMVKPVEFQEVDLPIDPYLLGVLIGDGGITSNVSISSVDDQVWSEVSKSLDKQFSGWSFTVRDDVTKTIVFKDQASNPLIKKLKELALFGCNSASKFIPDQYKLASIEQRLSLLQGLIDTDGYVNKKRSEVIYYTVSEELADNTLDIVRSLGGLARKRFKKSSYLNKDGKRIICKDCFLITFCLPNKMQPCRLLRKLENLSERKFNFCHFIKSVELLGKEESVCIKVSSFDSLYVTRDYILTHNTSESLEVMKNFLLTLDNAKGFYIKAEGRLSPEMRERSGVKFVFSAEEWVVGTCFVFESNIYETVVDIMRELVAKNEDKTKYCFLLDSVDGLITKGDLGKSFEDSNKVAGGAVIAANFMKRLSIALAKRGHMAIFISQVRADIKLDPYSKAPIRQTTATGGNALLHFANYIIEFEPRYKGDLILQDSAIKTINLKNPVIGHFAKATIKKSPNEKTNMTINYPIRYGRTNGTSIWIQKEIVDLLYAWEFVEKHAAWIKPVDEFREMLLENGYTLPDKIHGENNLFKIIEEDNNLCEFLTNYFKSAICKKTI